MMFDKEWWLKHGATYKDEFDFSIDAYKAQEEALAGILQGFSGIFSVLEIGCGFGRITQIAQPILSKADYVATDISAHAVDRAKEALGDIVKWGTLDLDDPPLKEEFALVLISEVLMHRTPVEVIEDVKKLAAMAFGFIINIDWYQPDFRKASPGCYRHDYVELFKPYGETHRIEVPTARQAIWITERVN